MLVLDLWACQEKKKTAIVFHNLQPAVWKYDFDSFPPPLTSVQLCDSQLRKEWDRSGIDLFLDNYLAFAHRQSLRFEALEALAFA